MKLENFRDLKKNVYNEFKLYNVNNKIIVKIDKKINVKQS